MKLGLPTELKYTISKNVQLLRKSKLEDLFCNGLSPQNGNLLFETIVNMNFDELVMIKNNCNNHIQLL